MKDIDGYVTKDNLYRLISRIKRKSDFVVDAETCIIIIKAISDMPKADVQPINQWVSVKDRLPDEPCECLGVVDGEVTEVNYSPKQMGYICVWSMCDADGFRPLPDDAVTHWMSLPEPPQD